MGKRKRAPDAPKYTKEDSFFVIEAEAKTAIVFVDFRAVSYAVGIVAILMAIGVAVKIARLFF